MKILAIDPGDIESAYVIWDGKKVYEFGKIKNEDLIDKINDILYIDEDYFMAVEMISSYGMPVGKEVFETCLWIGRFIQEYKKSVGENWKKVYRKDVKIHICESTKAKDSNIVQALVDRFGDTHNHGKYSKGTKRNPGFFYGFFKDVWQAFAIAVTFYDLNCNN